MEIRVEPTEPQSKKRLQGYKHKVTEVEVKTETLFLIIRWEQK